MKAIDWNGASELGLIERINREILHPLGLAMTRNPETGASEKLLIADDGVWTYSPEIKPCNISDEDIKKELDLIVHSQQDSL
jgi:hypothetical protein